MIEQQWNKDGHRKEFCHYCHQAFGSKQALERFGKGDVWRRAKFSLYQRKAGRSTIRIQIVPMSIEIIYRCWMLDDNFCEQNEGSYKNTPAYACCQFTWWNFDSIHLQRRGLYRQICWNLKQIKSGIFKTVKEVKPMEIRPEQEQEFQLSTRCSICNQHFKEDDEKLRDNCHFTVKYRGAAHVKCNLDYSFQYFKIPVFFHNLSWISTDTW